MTNAKDIADAFGQKVKDDLSKFLQAKFGSYLAALHQLYLAGMAFELNALGYHMTPYSPS